MHVKMMLIEALKSEWLLRRDRIISNCFFKIKLSYISFLSNRRVISFFVVNLHQKPKIRNTICTRGFYLF